MIFKIDPKIFETFPDLNIGVVVVKNMNNTGKNEEILSMIQKESERIKENYQSGTLKETPKLHAWREAYRTFGAKPKKYTCSVENLYRMILEGVELGHINKVVDIYNYISLKYMMPVGGDDVDKVDGDMMLTFADGREDFVRLNSDEVDHPKEGEVIYRDNKEVLCRRWNWRECDKSKMTQETQNVMLIAEGLSPTSREEVKSAISELSEMVQTFCGGQVRMEILDAQKMEVEIY